MRLFALLVFLGGCLPPSAGSFTPPMRFGIYQTAETLDPKEQQLTLGHVQSVALLSSPETGQTQLRLDAFIELDARLRKGFSENLEGQLSVATLLDQRIYVGRGGLKRNLPSLGKWRLAVEGGLGFGVDGSQSRGAATTHFLVAGADGALILSSPRDWAAAPYLALGTSANGTLATVGADAEGNPVNGQSPLFAPHVTTGVDLGFKHARVLLEATSLVVLGPPETAAFNVLVGFGVSFGVGKVRHIPSWERVPEGVKVYSNCKQGQIEVDGKCFTRCPEVLNVCKDSGQVCVLVASEPRCRYAPDLPAAPESLPEELPATLPQELPESVPASVPSSLPESAPASAPASEPASQPAETRDDLTICLAKDDGLSAQERIQVCRRYLEENPDSSFSLLVESRILELESEP